MCVCECEEEEDREEEEGETFSVTVTTAWGFRHIFSASFPLQTTPVCKQTEQTNKLCEEKFVRSYP